MVHQIDGLINELGGIERGMRKNWLLHNHHMKSE
jgi:hypothetical protein